MTIKATRGATGKRGAGSGVIPLDFALPFVGGAVQRMWLGHGRLMEIRVWNASGAGSIKVEDAPSVGEGTDLGTTAVISGTIPTIQFSGSNGTEIFSSVLLTVTGSITGVVVVRAEV